MNVIILCSDNEDGGGGNDIGEDDEDNGNNGPGPGPMMSGLTRGDWKNLTEETDSDK